MPPPAPQAAAVAPAAATGQRPAPGACPPPPRRPETRCPHGRDGERLLGGDVAGYEPLRLLRRRECQNVFLATAPDGGHVALKTTCRDAAADVLARARNEAHGLRAAATHQDTADLAGEGVHHDLHYLASTWQRGLTLHQLLPHLDRSMAAWSPDSAELFTHLALALGHAVEGLHRHGVVHADLSPGNIVLGHGRTLTLIDLDSCARDGDPAAAALNRCTTTAYAAPECLAPRPRPVPTPAADQYSAAAILHRVLRQRPHQPATGDRARTREHRLTHPVQPLTGWPAALWPDLPETLRQALDPDPDARHPTTGHFTARLRHALTLTTLTTRTGEHP
ncbi:protein kinase [Kitasatospora sp. NPDC059160]|uniref:protein kinase domain-containing protein n=1 Tax=Kitasatospora sp. NPDC059160 TaxID=3346748 RepID=UPI0036CF11DB